ncbi:MAG: glycosyltransferase family 39 protein [Clostridia bacterium]|nr:glycosyltransferase family 39 protein [Clostridia bacterium]
MTIGMSVAVSLLLIFFVYLAVIMPESKSKRIIEDKNSYALPLFLGLVIRIIIAGATKGYEADMNCWRGWSELMLQGGPWNFYRSDVFCDYSPGYLYVLWLLGGIKKLMGLTGTAEVILYKLPAIICDVLAGVVIYSLAQKEIKNKNISQALCLLYMLSPAVIINSAVWGQVDSIFTLFAVISLLLLTQEKYIKSALLIGVAVLIKPQALMLGPIFAFAFVQKIIEDRRHIKTLLISGAAFILTVVLPSLPFVISKTPDFLPKLYIGTMGSYPYATLNAANLFGAVGANFADQTQRFMGLSYQSMGTFAILAAVIISGIIFFKSKEKGKIFYCSGLILTIIFTFGVRMHERYLFPALIMFLVSFIYKREIRIFIIWTLLSLLHFVNVAITYNAVHISADNPVFILISAMTVATCIYAIYAGFKLFTKINLKKSVCIMKNEGRRITKKDMVIMLTVTLIYAVVAFCNLGYTAAPETKHDFNAEQGAVAVFEKTYFVDKVSYFKGLGDSEIKILTSVDGVNWRDDIVFESGDCFKWEQAEIQTNARYIGVTVADRNTELFEVAFYDKKGERLEVKSKSLLFDEQQLAAPYASYKSGTYFDEIYHARTAYEHINMVGSHYENTHPPLGKLIIGLGISLFGMNPFGWRFMGTLTGVLMLPLIYLLSKRMFKNSFLASCAMLLLAFDFMHFAQTRIATIDSFAVFFIMLMYYFMYIFYEEAEQMSMKKMFGVLAACGVSMGLGIASKWIDAYAGAGLAVLFVITMVRLYKHQKEGFAKKCLMICGWCVLVFVIIPFSIYYASYIPIHIADGSKNFWADFWNYQTHMLNYHSNVLSDHPFASKWYEWPIMKRPIWYYNGDGLAEGRISSISSFGNPLVWWGASLAVIILAITKIKAKDRRLSFIFIGFAAQFIPWAFVSREVFIYHFFASVPFIILALSYVMKEISESFKWGKKAVIGYIGAVFILFVMFYPVISGMEISHAYGQALELFETWVFCN